MSFKVGDTVKCINAGHHTQLHNGNVYEVSRIDGDGYVYLQDVFPNGFHAHRFGRVEDFAVEGFRVGDKVMCVNPGNNPEYAAMQGKTYVVSEIEKTGELDKEPLLVLSGAPIKSGMFFWRFVLVEIAGQ